MQPDSLNGSVQLAEKTVEPEVIDQSVQTIPPSQGPFSGDMSAGTLLFMATMGDEFIPWGTNLKGRDAQLRSFIPTEYRFNAALGIVSARNAAFSWKIEGPEQKAKKWQERLQNANFGQGWANLITQITVDLSTQDHGAFIEIIRDGARFDSEVIGLAHLDSARCYPTGRPEDPVWYQDRMGKFHKLMWWQVVHLQEMPSTYENMPGLGYCALTRLLLACRMIRDISIYIQEKVGGRNARAVTLVKGVTAKAVQEAWDAAKLRYDSAGMFRYSMPLLISAVDPKADIGFETLEIASLPDGFDLDVSEKQYTTQLAMAFMTDYQEFAPLPGGNLGTSAQSEILHAKSRGKGPGLFMKLISEAINFWVLPDDLEFKWDEQDPDADSTEAMNSKTRGESRALRIASGELTPSVARMIALQDGDLTQEQYDELLKQEEEAAAQAEIAALDQEIGAELTAATEPSPVDATIDEGATPESQTDIGGATIQDSAKDIRPHGVAGPPKVEQERLDTEESVTDAIANAFLIAREAVGRKLGVTMPQA